MNKPCTNFGGIKIQGKTAGDIGEARKTVLAFDTEVAEARAHAQTPVAVNPLNDPNSLLAQRSIYFTFDKSNVSSEYTPMLQAHAAYLVSHTSAKVQRQGNTDDRGSAEYNLALGQPRADAVHKSLTLLNVPDAQMSTISYGKENPVATGNDEAAWAKNRRTDIVYQSE